MPVILSVQFKIHGMKKVIVISFSIFVACTAANGQFLKKIENKVQSKVNQRVDAKENKEIDKGLDKTEQGLDDATKGQSPITSAGAGTSLRNTSSNSTGVQNATASSTFPSLKAYNNYDFVPGDKIVFEDHFTDDQDGEFPAHWNLTAGQGVLNKVGDYEALLLTAGNFAHVSPLIKGNGYLTDTFTIEFDSYTSGGYGPHLFFYNSTTDATSANNDLFQVNICPGNIWTSVSVTNHTKTLDLAGDYPAELKGRNYYNKWHHIAIAYRHNQVKVYVDQYRLVTVPNIGFNPKAIDIEGIGDAKTPIVIANLRIANGGGMNMLGKKFTDAKIITHGINFDVNKARIKPESMGTLNSIVQVMNDNPDVRFEVGGHTDSDGGDGINLPLSQQRADAVRDQLVSMGIDAGRLTAKGYGASRPIASNTTPEGKANNRRVEFVKM